MIEECDKAGLSTIQIGDLGFDYQPLSVIDSNKHKFIKGNHDNYNKSSSHCLGDYGLYNDIFFIRGGFSIDRKYRTFGVNYFPDEELNRQEREECFKLYIKIKPKIVISHEGPRSIIKNFTDSSILQNFGFNPKTFTTDTSELLQRCFEAHQPKIWFLGHYHRSWLGTINGTFFRLLNILEPYMLDTDLWTSSSI